MSAEQDIRAHRHSLCIPTLLTPRLAPAFLRVLLRGNFIARCTRHATTVRLPVHSVRLLRGPLPVYGNIDIVLDHFSRISQVCTTANTPCGMR